jgi:uncharacterized protein (DUF302 family)
MRRKIMLSYLVRLCAAVTIAFALGFSGDADANSRDGLVVQKSAYSIDETVQRLKSDIAEKGIMLFDVIDQQKLARGAKIDLPPSRLMVFGNPPLGIQFLTANPAAGLDWPVRLLVYQDATGQVWTAYTDFGWIAQRHGIDSRDQQFAMASEVIDSITSSVRAK